MLSFVSSEAPVIFTHDDGLMFDSPTVTETLSTNFALRWDAKTITRLVRFKFQHIVMHPGHNAIQVALHTNERPRVSSIIRGLE